MSTSNQRQHNSALAQAGENQAATYLRQKGYQIYAQNWRHGQDEIDLIAFDPTHQEIVFVEVKTRGDDFYGDPDQAYDQRKLQAQLRAANYYLRQCRRTDDYRFDLITILPTSLNHFENITWP